MSLLIVTPTLGASPFLHETLASIRAGTEGGPSHHFIVAPAATGPALVALAPAARVVAETGRGMYAALNTALAAAADSAWDWFTYLNDDDVWRMPGFRAALAIAADPGNSADVVYGRVQLVRERGQAAGELPIARRPADLRALLAQGIIPIAQPGTVVRRALLERLRGFDAGYRSAGDLDLWVRALAAGARFAYAPHVVAAFRLRPGQLSREVATVATETARALTPLREGPSRGPTASRLRFRLANLGVYLDRFRRHGWKRMEDVYRTT